MGSKLRPGIAVVETKTFRNRAASLFSDNEIDILIGNLASNPTVGDLIPGTGGVRKMRVAVGAKGKRGGARIIYYFHSVAMPLVLITAYGKSERADVSPALRSRMRTLVDTLIEEFLGSR